MPKAIIFQGSIYNDALHDFYVENFDILLGFLLIHSGIFNLMDDIKALCATAENRMLAIEPRLCVVSGN